MPQIARRKLPKDIEEKIYRSFFEAVKLIANVAEAQLFFEDLLTPTERVMLPKRVAIAILLSKGWSNEMICSRLNVTQTTIAAIARRYELAKGFKLIIAKLKKSEAARSLWQDIENLLYRLGTPAMTLAPDEVVKRRLGHRKKTLV